MKKIKLKSAALLFFFLLAAGSVGKAQTFMGRNRVKVFTDIMKSRLGLSDTQTEKVFSINTEFAQKVRPLLTGADDKITKVKQLKKLLGQREDELKVVFTSQQFNQFKVMKSERQALLKGWLEE